MQKEGTKTEAEAKNMNSEGVKSDNMSNKATSAAPDSTKPNYNVKGNRDSGSRPFRANEARGNDANGNFSSGITRNENSKEGGRAEGRPLDAGGHDKAGDSRVSNFRGRAPREGGIVRDDAGVNEGAFRGGSRDGAREGGSRDGDSRFSRKPRVAKNIDQNNDDDKKLVHVAILESKRIAKVKKGGRYIRVSVVAIAGDKMGSIGYGIGKAFDSPEARKKATNRAKKNMRLMPIYENRTILHDTSGTCGATSIILRKARPGTSIIASPKLSTLFDLMGIKDIVAKKVAGPSNIINSIEAIFKALDVTARTQFFAELESRAAQKNSGESKSVSAIV